MLVNRTVKNFAIIFRSEAKSLLKVFDLYVIYVVPWKLANSCSLNKIINNYSSTPNGLWVIGRMGYLLRGHEGERNNCFSIIQLVGQKYRE